MKQQEKIDAYLMGQLSEAEDRAFRADLQRDGALAKEVEVRRNMLLAIRQVGRQELRQTLEGIHRDLQPQADPREPAITPIRRILPWLGALAAAAILLLLLIRTPDNQSLYPDYYQPYELSLNLRDTSPNADQTQALRQYREGNYAAALPLFERLAASEPQQSQYQMAIAICQIELGQTAAAQSRLQQLYDSGDPFLVDEAAWYLGLMALKAEDLSTVQSYLRPLADDPRADHHGAARDLLDTLK